MSPSVSVKLLVRAAKRRYHNSMNKLLAASAIAVVGFVSQAGFSQETKTNNALKIEAAAARDNVGKQATVTGKVAEVSKREKLVRLNLDKPYPKETFTAVIFVANTNHFGDFETLKGKSVEISGKIADYRGHPQIILTSTNQLKVLESSEEKK